MTNCNMDITTTIQEKLNEIEQSERVRAIMAVESGSRAWGFASPDSDYDVRFIYVRQTEDYLRLMPLRDVIEWQLDDVYDINGWDLTKALKLLHDSNPVLHEWCNSPILYRENELAQPFRELAADYFIPKKALFHYIKIAKSNYRQNLTKDEVRIKKYFYSLRPILAARWVAEFKNAPPMLFNELAEAELPKQLAPITERLLEAKRHADEVDTCKRIPELDTYIIDQIGELELIAEKEENKRNSWDALEAFFRTAVTKEV